MTLARTAGVFYLLTFVFGSLALAGPSGRALANLLSSLAYLGVVVLFYWLFKAAGTSLSAAAACVGLFGVALSIAPTVHGPTMPINPLGVFGVYCLLIGVLIFRCGFLPPWLGVLLAIGGLSWLTFAWPLLARSLSPFNFAPGILAEGVLTVRLLTLKKRATASASVRV
jgi:uncharacterized protein DUF4386